RMLGSSAPAGGHLWAHASVSGPAAQPLVTTELRGQNLKLGRLAPQDFSARVTLGRGELKIDELSVPAGPGVVKAQGVVRLSSGFPVSGTVELHQASFGAIMAKAGVPGAWVDYLANGRVGVQGKLTEMSLWGDADLKLERFRLTTHPFDVPPK